MLVKTNFLGVEETIEVSEEQIFSFDPGVGGFESLRRYALIPEQDSPVEWLQSLEDPDVAFALLEPFAFKPDYAFELADADAEALGMREAQDALVRCVLTLHEDPEKITANLLAPLIFSRRTHMARQVILQNNDYALRFALFTEVAAGEVDSEEAAEAESELALRATA
ncbi:MAG: flagellar assembly protein FliW [Dehalococcoidia bacterium]